MKQQPPRIPSPRHEPKESAEPQFQVVGDRLRQLGWKADNQPEPKSEMGSVTFLIALTIICASIVGIIYILFG